LILAIAALCPFRELRPASLDLAPCSASHQAADIMNAWDLQQRLLLQIGHVSKAHNAAIPYPNPPTVKAGSAAAPEPHIRLLCLA